MNRGMYRGQILQVRWMSGGQIAVASCKMEITLMDTTSHCIVCWSAHKNLRSACCFPLPSSPWRCSPCVTGSPPGSWCPTHSSKWWLTNRSLVLRSRDQCQPMRGQYYLYHDSDWSQSFLRVVAASSRAEPPKSSTLATAWMAFLTL